MKLVKNYWFGTLIGTLLLGFLILFVLILISPKQDIKNRGFISCTQEMVGDLLECDKQISDLQKTIEMVKQKIEGNNNKKIENNNA